MRIADLRSKGAFVSTEPVKRTIEWTHQDAESGEIVTDTFDVWVIHPSFGMIETAFKEEKSEIKSAQSAAIAACIRLGEDATERLSYDDAYNLNPTLAQAMIAAINSTGAVPKKPKRSLTRKNSGTN
jgi:endo-alpha-1,4-polygalactosaminidase (GH114 family)